MGHACQADMGKPTKGGGIGYCHPLLYPKCIWDLDQAYFFILDFNTDFE